MSCGQPGTFDGGRCGTWGRRGGHVRDPLERSGQSFRPELMSEFMI
ncbi:hypothetical protein FM103_04310 [Corynebacterium xerosis]|nr:hypothetical protein FM103_04310 [Corynebacterium xerosis]